MICRCPNIAALAFLLPVLYIFFYLYWKVCANIYISHQCLSNEKSESGCAVPRSCQWVRQAIRDKPRQLPNLFHHEVGVVRGARPVCYAHTSSHAVSCSEGMHCWKVGPRWQLVSTSFQQVFACVHTAHILTLQRQSWSWRCWFTTSLTDRVGKSDSLVYLAMVVLIGLVNRIFHKRSDGLEQFLFCARRGMCLFHSLKGDFCVAQLWQPNSFLSASTLCFCVFSVNTFVPRRHLILSFVFVFHPFSLFSVLNAAFVVV